MNSLSLLSRCWVFTLLLFAPTAAWAGSLSGKVASSANVAQQGVLIEAIQSSTTVASATTDASGNYSIATLADGNYTVKATPPTGSLFSVASVPGVAITGAAVQDIVLVSNASTSKLSLTILDALAQRWAALA